MKSDRSVQGTEKKKQLKNTRISYAKEKDERDDLVNVDGIKNGKIILSKSLYSLCLRQRNIQLCEKMTSGPPIKVCFSYCD